MTCQSFKAQAYLLYFVYTIDIPHIFNNRITTINEDAVNKTYPDATTFVDDTTVNIYKTQGTTLQQSLDSTLQKLTNYMRNKKLVMNKSKTKIMVISKNPDRHKQVVIPSQPKNIYNSHNIKLLGVEISDNLKWNNFLFTSKMSIYKQLNTRVNALKILKRTTPFKTLKLLANVIFALKLYYGAEL